MKKRLFEESSNSSFFEPDVFEIPAPATWKSKSSKRNSTVGQEIIVVDDEDPADVVIIDEKVVSNGKGKKPMVYYPAEHEVITLDEVPSQGADFVKGKSIPHVSFINDGFTDIGGDSSPMLHSHFESNTSSRSKTSVPEWSASAASAKYKGTASSSSPYFTRSKSKVGTNKVVWFKPENSIISSPSYSSASKTACFGSKSSFSGLPATMSHSQTNGINQALFLGSKPYAHSLMSPNPPYMPHSTLNNNVTTTSLPSTFRTSKNLNLHDNVAEISPPSTSAQSDSSQNSILKKLELFKKFDTIEDHSGHGHHYEKKTVKQKSKGWANKIADEWKMLEKDLPDTIFARVYEDRMDLLRAVILGADGTPYHDGLFFFDVHFTASYPRSPPLVNYHAHGLRINPNLYACGKVCLSLLGTWTGSANESWLPHKSNMLQVLVSIQGLVLNAEPYYNEPGYAHTKNPPFSKAYSENAFILSLKTMIYTMRNPPKNFEDLVFGHFYNRAHEILAACRAYLDGVEVGSYVKGKAVNTQTYRKTCSQLLKKDLPSCIKTLVEAFTKIGVKGCEKYLVPVNNS